MGRRRRGGGRHRRRRPRLLHRRRPRRAVADGRHAAASTGAGWAPSSRCTTGCGTSASRRSPASTAPASAAATSSRWPATCRSRRRRVHPPRGARARIGAGRRRDPVAADHRRRPAGARDRDAVRADLAGPGARVGPGRRGSRLASELDATVADLADKPARGSCPRRCATRRPSSTGGATWSGRRPSSTPATGWRSTPRPMRPARRCAAFHEKRAPRFADLRRLEAGEGRTCPSCGGADPAWPRISTSSAACAEPGCRMACREAVP